MFQTGVVQADNSVQDNPQKCTDNFNQSVNSEAEGNAYLEEKTKKALQILNDHEENFKNEDGTDNDALKPYDGGQWIEYDQACNPYAVIAMVDRYQGSPPLKNPIPSVAKIVSVEYSIDELQQLHQTIGPLMANKGAKLYGLIQSMGVDPTANRFFIRARPENIARLSQILSGEKVEMRKIILESDDSSYRPLERSMPLE